MKALLTPAPRSIKERKFFEFHDSNPHVYEELKNLALELKRSGVQKYGICGLYEVLRWKSTLNTKHQKFKLPNGHKPHYARLIMARVPELQGFFETRTMQEEK